MKSTGWFRIAFVWLILFKVPAQAQDSLVNSGSVAAAEKLIDLDFSPAQRDSMMDGLRQELQTIRYFHSRDLPNDLPMALDFDPRVPGRHYEMKQLPLTWKYPEVRLPERKEGLAYYSILQLGSLIRHHQMSSVDLTRFFLARLSRWGDTLHCLVTLTPQIALLQARMADSEFARGIDRGPLQGIPYGLKDLFSAAGTPTTWGSPPYRHQPPGPDSWVYTRLRQAGAVLVAKLSLGELAMGDVWFGGMTRNPWDLSQGSGGSSAGPASATAAGLVPFAIGTETWGSIVDPSATCGLTGLRPSFGSVSRSGAMTLAWSSDKIGPLCRSAEDAALVFSAIHGSDGLDRSARWMPFNYPGQILLSGLKMAYVSNYLDSLPAQNPDRQVLAELTRLGAHLQPMVIPSHLHGSGILGTIIGAESAAAFDGLTRSHRDSLMVQQGSGAWPNQFRTSRFIPAVEYIQACRLRYRLLVLLDSLMAKFDVIVCPTFSGDQLALTNLVGYPVVVMPDGFDPKGHPQSITFIGKLYGEGKLLAAAKAFQDATGFQSRHPVLFR